MSGDLRSHLIIQLIYISEYSREIESIGDIETDLF